MASDNAAEAALPAGSPAVLRPYHRLFQGIACGQLCVRIGTHHRLLRGTDPGPSGEIRLLRPWAFARRIATRGHVGLGESYMAGHWDSPDLTALLRTLGVNEAAFSRVVAGGWMHRLLSPWRHRRRSNTRTGSRRNIAYHYDLGNDFYRLWLDPSMTYSCGIRAQDDDDLEQSQHNKYRRLLDSLSARPGQHLLEIGCGWGGLARQAAQSGLRVTGLTLSEQQLAWAQDAVRDTPLAERIDLRLQDYRDVQGQFDHIVSIEMFEAVGEAYWPTYMQTLARCLRRGGRAALQVITIDDAFFDDYRASPDFIQHYVFPGGMLPTVGRFDAAAAAAGLQVVRRSFHGQDYAHTLAAWRQRFEAKLDAVLALGYDQRFIRLWRYYLSYCEAGFLDRRVDVMQVTLAHAPDA